MHREDPERALLVALRWAIPPTLFVPLAFALVAASANGEGPPVALAWPPLVLALTTNASLWLKVVVLWRRLPPGDEDDDQDWRRRFGGDPPPGPDGGPSGVNFDWTSFEREFWSYVREEQGRRERELVHARANEHLNEPRNPWSSILFSAKNR
jgi:hypothetical protein